MSEHSSIEPITPLQHSSFSLKINVPGCGTRIEPAGLSRPRLPPGEDFAGDLGTALTQPWFLSG